MSNEQTTDRTVASVQQEYTQLCARAGHLQYQLMVLQDDLDLLNGQLKELNVEAATLAQQSKKEGSNE